MQELARELLESALEGREEPERQGIKRAASRLQRALCITDIQANLHR